MFGLSTFAIACLAGIGLGQIGVGYSGADAALLVSAAGAAGLAALWPLAPWAVSAIIGAIAGTLIGLDSTPDPGTIKATIVTLLGSLIGTVVGMLYVVGGVHWLTEKTRKTWLLIGVRIAAAWVATITVLLLALEFAELAPVLTGHPA